MGEVFSTSPITLARTTQARPIGMPTAAAWLGTATPRHTDVALVEAQALKAVACLGAGLAHASALNSGKTSASTRAQLLGEP